MVGDVVYGEKRPDGKYDYEVRYDAGPGDKEYMRQRDCNYLARLLREDHLKKEEPDVWHLREIDHAQERDIGEWWSEKLLLPNIEELLASSAAKYQRMPAAARATGCEEVWPVPRAAAAVKPDKPAAKPAHKSRVVPAVSPAPVALRTVLFSTLKLDEKIGEGGFGEVFKASYDFVTVAVKRLKAARLSEDSVEEFTREAAIMADLRHPHIAQILAICTEVGKYCMIIEYMEGGSLFDYLHARVDIDWNTKYRIAHETAIGLAVLHSRRILHRDLKSLNVLLDRHLTAKLTDFGLAKVKSETSSTTTAGNSVGTVAWMAPECFARRAKTTEKTDIYAMGMILWELAAREIPWKDAAAPAIIIQWVLAGDKEDIPEDTPPSYAALIARCWETDPARRPEAPEIVHALEALKSATAASAAAARSADGVDYSGVATAEAAPSYMGITRK